MTNDLTEMPACVPDPGTFYISSLIGPDLAIGCNHATQPNGLKVRFAGDPYTIIDSRQVFHTNRGKTQPTDLRVYRLYQPVKKEVEYPRIVHPKIKLLPPNGFAYNRWRGLVRFTFKLGTRPTVGMGFRTNPRKELGFSTDDSGTGLFARDTRSILHLIGVVYEPMKSTYPAYFVQDIIDVGKALGGTIAPEALAKD